MLIKGFYKTQSINLIDSSFLQVNIRLNKDHDIFNGHFPGNPITPGVCMIQTIKEITQNQVNRPLFLRNISNVKFTALINPNINPDLILELSLIKENDTIKVKNITKFRDGTIALKCNVTFVKK